MDKRRFAFWELVAAVVIGVQFSDWLRSLKANPDFAPWITPLVLAAFVLFVVGKIIVTSWDDRRFLKNLDKRQLDEARSHGFESYAEYMVVHGYGDDVRDSYKKKAAAEKQKRDDRASRRFKMPFGGR
jgi:hypothetical protein